MRRRPRVGTRVIVISGEYAGRQGRTTDSSGYGAARVADLLGGAHILRIGARIEDVAIDLERKIRKLPARPLEVGAVLYALVEPPMYLGRRLVVVAGGPSLFEITSEFGHRFTLAPTPGFEQRWTHLDGSPVLVPLHQDDVVAARPRPAHSVDARVP